MCLAYQNNTYLQMFRESWSDIIKLVNEFRSTYII